MKPVASNLFSEHDLNRIQEAVGHAELGTSGEVVPYIVDQSDEYAEAELRSALTLSLIPLVTFPVLSLGTDLWISLDALELVFVVLLCMLLGWLLADRVPFFKRLFAGEQTMQRRVEQRAAEAFLSEEVFQTGDRTGVLIFISVLERKVLVLGDSGINAKVEKSEWEEIVRHVVQGIHSGKRADSIIEAMKMCGNLLKAWGFTARADDTNELPNSLRRDD